jgi:hypothetical protein
LQQQQWWWYQWRRHQQVQHCKYWAPTAVAALQGSYP